MSNDFAVQGFKHTLHGEWHGGEQDAYMISQSLMVFTTPSSFVLKLN